MKKGLKIVLIICASLIFLIIAFFAGIRIMFLIGDKENDQLVEKYMNKTIVISDVEKLDNFLAIDDGLKSSIKSCEVFFTPTAFVLTTVQCYYGSGELTITEDYYDKLLKEYNDWKLVSGFPSTKYLGYFESDIMERADNNFLTLLETKNIIILKNYSIPRECLYFFHRKKAKCIFL